MHIPQRMCIACRQMLPKGDLIKAVKTENGAVIDTEKKLPGRGAYVCKNPVCIQNARKKRLLSRHFKTAVDPAVYDEIERAAKEI